MALTMRASSVRPDGSAVPPPLSGSSLSAPPTVAGGGAGEAAASVDAPPPSVAATEGSNGADAFPGRGGGADDGKGPALKGDAGGDCNDDGEEGDGGDDDDGTAETFEMDSEEENRLAAELQAELEDLRRQTKSALEASWAEVERLQLEGSASSDRVAELERELEALMRSQRGNGGGGGGGYCGPDDATEGTPNGVHGPRAVMEIPTAGLTSDDETAGDAASVHSGGFLGNAIRRIASSSSFASLGALSAMIDGDLVEGDGDGAAMAAAAAAAGDADGPRRGGRRKPRRRKSGGTLRRVDPVDDEGEHGGQQQQRPRRRSTVPEPSDDHSHGSGFYGRRLSDTGVVCGWTKNPDDDEEEDDDEDRRFAGEEESGGGDCHRSRGSGSGSALDLVGGNLSGSIKFGPRSNMSGARSVGDLSDDFGGDLDDGATEDDMSVGAMSTATGGFFGRAGRTNRRMSCTGRMQSDGGAGGGMVRSRSSIAMAGLAAAFDAFGDGGRGNGGGGGDPASDDESGDAAVRADMMAQLSTLEHEKSIMVEELETKLRGKEAAIETLERSTSQQAQTISELQAELEELKRQAEEGEKSALSDMDEVRSEIERNEAAAASLEVQVSEAERTLEARREREEALRSELAEMEERVRRADEHAAEHLAELEERLRKANVSRAVYEEKNQAMRQEADEALARLRVDLAGLLPDEKKSEDLIAELMGHFDDLRKKEEELGEVLVARMQERGEVMAALDTIKHVHKRAAKGLEALHDMRKRFESSMLSMRVDDDGKYDDDEEESVGLFIDEETEKMTHRHKVAIAALEKAAVIQERVRESLHEVEVELMDRLASLVWDKSQEEGGEAAAPERATATDNSPDRRNRGGNNVMGGVEKVQEEAKVCLQEIRVEMEKELAAIDGGQNDKKSTASIEDDEDNLEKLEEELSMKDAKIAKLQATTAEHEETVESLREELGRLQRSTQEESKASLEVMERLQREVQAIVDRVAEKDRMIANLTSILEQKKASEKDLKEELEKIQAEAAARANDPDMPDFPVDLGHVGI